MFSRIALLAAAFPVLLAAQASVEHALGSAHAAAAAAPAKKVGNAIGATFDRLGRALQTPDTKPATPQVSPDRPGRRAKAAVAPQVAPGFERPNPSVSFEDPAEIKEGIEYAELMRRFGPPAMKLTTGPGEETLCYSRKNQNLDVLVRK